MRFQKLDRRHRGYLDFRWCIFFKQTSNHIEGYRQVRAWCWETFGASDEYEIWYRSPPDSRNEKWAWDYFNQNDLRIYLDEDSYSWAILKWKQ